MMITMVVVVVVVDDDKPETSQKNDGAIHSSENPSPYTQTHTIYSSRGHRKHAHTHTTFIYAAVSLVKKNHHLPLRH